MIHERSYHGTDRRNARTNAEETAPPGVAASEGTQQYEGETRSRSSQVDPRTDTADDDESTATDRSAGGATGSEGTRIDTVLPAAVYREGRTVTASGPTDGDVERFLRRVYRNTPPVDGVIVLTTERDATEVLRAYTEPADEDENRAGIGIIDTRSAGQYIEDVYRERPIHYTAADSDIERTAMSVTELVEALSTSPAQRIHLFVDSYSDLRESLSREERARLLNTFHSQIDGYEIYVTDETDEVLRRWTTGAIRVGGDGDETRYRRV